MKNNYQVSAPKRVSIFNSRLNFLKPFEGWVVIKFTPRFLCTLIFMLACVWVPNSVASADNPESCVDAYSNKQWRSALIHCKTAAKSGDSVAQLIVGYMYRNGSGVEQNHTEAVRWFHRSAERGNPDAQRNIGTSFRFGYGTAMNLEQAIYWYKLAAEQDHTSAQVQLVDIYYGESDYPRDYAKAAYWAKRAAANGDAYAQLVLGEMHFFAQGVKQDDIKSFMWIYLSAGQGNERAIEVRNSWLSLMPPRTTTEGARLARACIRRGYKNCD